MFRALNRVASAEFTLSADGPVLVSAKESNKLNPTLPDSTFIRGRFNEQGAFTYLIPGSSIKGVIRSRYCDFRGQEVSEKLFGFINNRKKEVQKSKISFHDAYAEITTVSLTTRYSTAIDPSRQSAKGGSLNNLQAVEKGDFKAGFRCVNYTDDEMLTILKVLADINLGIVRFGGKKSRGFGMMHISEFKLTAMDGYTQNFEPVCEQKFYTIEEAQDHFSGKGSSNV